MKMLISKIELDSKRSRDKIPLECFHCGKTHYRTKNTILRILNGGLQNTGKGNYCSKKCVYLSNQNRQKFECKLCRKEVERVPSAVNGNNIFCSSSCSAKFNNINRLKKIKYNKHYTKRKLREINCQFCQKSFQTKRKSQKYCTAACRSHELRQKTFSRIENGEKVFHSLIKKYLLSKKDNKCELCGITEWKNLPIVLIMDHIDGNSENNSLQNLRLICSNCDSTLPTYKSKNRGNGRILRRIRYQEGKSY